LQAVLRIELQENDQVVGLASVGRTRYPIDLDIFNIGYRPKKWAEVIFEMGIGGLWFDRIGEQDQYVLQSIPS
jgi:hypothetical protein